MDTPLIGNVADARQRAPGGRATTVDVEPEDERWTDTGVNVQVMQPGRPNCLHHSEPVQEDFLVLHGKCIAIVDGQERPPSQWDFLHCPAGTEHVFVGAGDGPRAVLMIGSRRRDETHQPVNELPTLGRRDRGQAVGFAHEYGLARYAGRPSDGAGSITTRVTAGRPAREARPSCVRGLR